MKTATLTLLFWAPFLWAQKAPLQELPKIKLDSTNVYNFIPKSIKKTNFYGKSLNENTERIPYKIMVKNIENPELYTILGVAPKENTIPIPNAYQKNIDNLEKEIPEPKK